MNGKTELLSEVNGKSMNGKTELLFPPILSSFFLYLFSVVILLNISNTLPKNLICFYLPNYKIYKALNMLALTYMPALNKVTKLFLLLL